MTKASVNSFVTNGGGQAAAFAGICSDGSTTTVSCLDAVTNNATNEAGSVAANNQNAQNLMDITTSANNSNITIDPNGSGTLALGSADNTAVTIDAKSMQYPFLHT